MRRRIVQKIPAAKAATASLLASVAVLAVPPHAHADPGHGSGRSLPARVEALYTRASEAAQAHEKAKRKAARQRAELRKLRAAERRNRAHRLRLNDLVGAAARAQYRSGPLTAGATLLSSESPDALMYRLSVKRQGDHALGHLLTAVREAGAHYERERVAEERALKSLKRTQTRRAALRAGIERKLRRVDGEVRAAQSKRGDAKNGGHRPAGGPAPGKCAYGGDGRAHRANTAWTLPTSRYWLSAGFGGRGAHWANRHTGQDFAVSQGTSVRAVGAGTVVRVACDDGFGNQVVVGHPNGYYTQYAHLSETRVREGQGVAAGEELGLSGETGNAQGPHLHFEVRLTESMGSAIDPLPWLRQHGVSP